MSSGTFSGVVAQIYYCALRCFIGLALIYFVILVAILVAVCSFVCVCPGG